MGTTEPNEPLNAENFLSVREAAEEKSKSGRKLTQLCWMGSHGKRKERGSLWGKDGTWLTASKEMRASVLQAQRTRFSQKPE